MVGRPPNPDRPTGAVYAARSRAARGVVTVGLSRDTLDAIATIMAATGEPDRPTVIRRLVEAEAGRIAVSNDEKPAAA